MKFTPKTTEELAKATLLTDGIYDAEIGTAEDKVSAAGNDMIKIDLTVYAPDGGKRFVYDYLMEKMAYKLRHAAESCGLLEKYEAGNIEADDFIGKSCKVKIKIDDKNKDFAPKNVVVDYVVGANTSKPMSKKEAEDQFDDSVPF